MSNPITLSIDVNMLDKTKFKEFIRRNGQKATFVDLILFPSPTSEFGDFIVKQQQPKAERLEGKVQMPILGNAKFMEARTERRAEPEPAADKQP